jgi:hydrogenase maturation protein HypF
VSGDFATGPGPGGATVRRRLVVRGVVQGVGFRPYVAGLADDLALAGWCHNDSGAVEIEVEGPAARVGRFEERLVAELPPLALVESVEARDIRPDGGGDGFRIAPSRVVPGGRTMVPPDTATCAACLAELTDPQDRRYRHPFITCTHCGPRLTITLDLPYDRAATTMAGFPMCAACAAEYADPADRRYHAQPVACHDCGPTLRVLAPDGAVLAEGTEPALAAAVDALRRGGVVAVKGLGGYHLACDAASDAAVAALRERKRRPEQPFAVMARDLATARCCVDLGGATEVLTSPARPIVLLPVRADAPVSSLVAPGPTPRGLGELGVLLPYTPLHHLLFADLPDGSPGAPPVLVMTSGNSSGEPLCATEDDALRRLGGIADLLLTHDREIAVPVEDSVVAWSPPTGAVPVRRSRGHAPLPVALPGDTGGAVVLAAGAELKNTVALARDGRAFVSAHVGDLASLASRVAHQRVTDQLLRFHGRAPALLVADRHPGYASRAWARRFAAELDVPVREVQHHHAHLASLAAEHDRLDEPLLGLVYDGTGYGCDTTVWGGELLLLGDGGRSADRLGHLGAVRLPGADAGIRNPVRTAALALLDAGVPLAGTAVDAELTEAESRFVAAAHGSGAGLVVTSSVGRLFDVVASLLGIRHRVSYEAQAAVELEAVARAWRAAHPGEPAPGLPLPVRRPADPDAPAVLDPGPLVRALAVSDAAPDALAFAFHTVLAAASADLAATVAERTGVTVVGLSGGVFVNRVLLAVTSEALARRGLEVLTHRRVPANDGGLSLGQVAVGARTLETVPTPGP